MKSKLKALVQSRLLFAATQTINLSFFNASLIDAVISHPRSYATAVLPVVESYGETIKSIGNRDKRLEPADVLRRWGCSENDVSVIFLRQPSLHKIDVNNLQSKLQILSDLGVSSSDLVKIIHCRPRLLNCRLNKDLDQRIEYLERFFGSREVLLKAILRNPSLLTYDLHHRIKPVIAIFVNVGLSRKELIPMLLSRPTLIPRCNLNDEKMDYIRRTGVSKDSRMYKYVVTLFSISRIETIHEKIANLEKFGFSEDEILSLFGRSPLLLTLSVDKVQRNMTFALGTMKLSASTIACYPCLLYLNLETSLKPRYLLAEKIDDRGLVPRAKGPSMIRALRMTEKRFIKAFISCHPEAVAKELMIFYRSAKGIKRLAESSKRNMRKGFPF
ncbi:hypothetical protein ACH5RR_004261 [Cinchona calisaya]|uniref:Uncharacterized protein n=1 Tax=Cinchona calisaya TaxID=153742 RepID=A0ABD3AX51_9GENT